MLAKRVIDHFKQRVDFSMSNAVDLTAGAPLSFKKGPGAAIFERTVAIVLLCLAGMTFLAPTFFGLSIVAYNHSFPAAPLLRGIFPLYSFER
jgi:hypothetical protein